MSPSLQTGRTRFATAWTTFCLIRFVSRDFAARLFPTPPPSPYPLARLVNRSRVPSALAVVAIDRAAADAPSAVRGASSCCATLGRSTGGCGGADRLVQVEENARLAEGGPRSRRRRRARAAAVAARVAAQQSIAVRRSQRPRRRRQRECAAVARLPVRPSLSGGSFRAAWRAVEREKTHRRLKIERLSRVFAADRAHRCCCFFVACRCRLWNGGS